MDQQQFSVSNLNALAGRRRTNETELLERRLAPLDTRLQSETERFGSGVQIVPTRCATEDALIGEPVKLDRVEAAGR